MVTRLDVARQRGLRLRGRRLVAHLAVLSAVGVVFPTANIVFACSCAELGTVSERFAHADAVFVGAAEAFDVEVRESAERWNRKVGVWAMDVSQVFKGPAETRMTIHTDITTSCSFHFELHDRYVVFAHYGPDGVLSTGQCTGTIRLPVHPDLLDDLPPPILDTARPGGAVVEVSPEESLAILETSKDGRSRVGAWAAIERLDVPPARVLAAAERSLEVGDDAEWILAVNAIDAAAWDEIDPYEFVGAVLSRGNWRTAQEALDRLDERLENDHSLVQTLGRAVLERDDSALDDSWLRVTAEDEIRDAIVMLLKKPGRSGLDRGVSAILDLKLADPRFVPLLTGYVDTVADDDELSFVAWALGYQGASTMETLIELLKSEFEWGRESAAYGLGLVGAEAAEAIGPLTAALADESKDVQAEAALALERVERGLGWPVYEAWRTGDFGDRVRAAEFLRSLKTDYAIAEMIERLADPDCHTYIVYGLSEAGTRATGALPRLREIASGTTELSRHAAEAVRKIEAAVATD